MAADATSNVAEYAEEFKLVAEDRELEVESGECLEVREG